MDKTFQPQRVEKKIYERWERSGAFTPKVNPKKKPFTIILPLPNANDPLHIGHALFTVEDIMVRYHRMRGDPTLWLPGADHAGIETQYVFEKYLEKKGKSRFDFDRETLYRMIYDFVEKNRDINRKQLKRLGFSLDWTRYHYSLEPAIIKKVLATFRKLHADGLIYRGERIVNYCTQCGTAFSDLEVEYEERKDPLYYMRYGPFILATTRPETKFGDTAVAVNPKDKRYQKLIGSEFIYESLIGPRKMRVIADDVVDVSFGTGAVKVTPAHDPVDFEIAQRHNLPTIKVIDLDGKLNRLAGRFAGLTVAEARRKVVAELQERGDLVKVDNSYHHRVGFCYRCGATIEPMVIPQWFVKIKPLALPALEAVKRGRTKIVPKKRFEKMYLEWMRNIRDWNISRQIVWGPRIPVWYCLDCNPNISISFVDGRGVKVSGDFKKLREKYGFSEIKEGLQQLHAPVDVTYSLEGDLCKRCGGRNVLQETDTFDTWFLSGQWPLTTLGFPDSPDFKYFYPTSVLDTLWDILFFWVARMMMFGLYLAKEVPFKVVHMHCRVVDEKGQKMSKSKGNVIDPIEMVEEYGADALRMACVFGAAPGSDICLGHDKLRAMRNFANKVWNIGRFISMNLKSAEKKVPVYSSGARMKLASEDRKIIKECEQLIKQVTNLIERYRFDLAAEKIYHFIWHRFADQYIEYSKEKIRNGDLVVLAVLRHVYLNCLKLLHPFMPFVTEAIWENLGEENLLITSSWPKVGK